MDPHTTIRIGGQAGFETLRQQDGNVAAELQGIANELEERITGIIGSIHELAEPIAGETDQAPLTQAVVNQTVGEIVDNPDLATQLVQASGLFKELDQLEKHGDGDGDDKPRTFFKRSINGLVFTNVGTEPHSRSYKRKFDPFLPKTHELVAFCDRSLAEEPNPIPIDKLRQLSQIAQPAHTTEDRLQQMFKEIPSGDLDPIVLANFAAARESVSPQLDLSPAKLLVFSEILKIFKLEAVIKAAGKLGDGEIAKEVVASPYGLYHETNWFIESARNSNEEITSHIRMLHNAHGKGRIMNIPARQFSRAMDRLAQLGYIYRYLTLDEAFLQEMPERASILRKDSNIVRKEAVSNLVAEGANSFTDAFNAMASLVNNNLHQTDDESEKEHFWGLARLFDSAKIELATWFKHEVDSLGIEAHHELIAEKLLPSIDLQIHRRNEKQQLEELAPEIEVRLEEFQALDSVYTLSNSQLRHRHSELIPLAKKISDGLSEHEPVSAETLRAFTGLLLGVYRERTGQNASTELLANSYVEDAARLRELSFELEFLGQPVGSKLLNMMNLLDELIESGFFEDPAFEQFSDFIIEYLVALEGKSAEASGTDEPEEDTPILPVPAPPVEAIRQADYEDIKVFPPGSNAGDVQEDYIRVIGEIDLPIIEWGRITKLIELRDQFSNQDLEVSLIRTKHASWQVLPFFVLEVRLPEQPFAVAVVESPVYGNATYIYREARDRPEWREVVQLERHEAREFGAVPKVHIDGSRLDNHVVKVWNHVISDLTIRQ